MSGKIRRRVVASGTYSIGHQRHGLAPAWNTAGLGLLSPDEDLHASQENEHPGGSWLLSARPSRT